MKKRKTSRAGSTILAIGAHPDDLELWVGGTLHQLARSGHRVVAIDLTRGESGTRGSADRRRQEAMQAAGILGIADRENLDLGDAGLEFSLPQRRAVAAAVRRHRPEMIIAPWTEDLHPDHAVTGRLVQAAFYEARLSKLAAEHEPWFTRTLLFYPCRNYHHPTVVIDVTREYPFKKKALLAHRSQIEEDGGRVIRPAWFTDPFSLAEVRDRYFGSLIGVAYGEGLIATSPLSLTSLSTLLPKPWQE